MPGRGAPPQPIAHDFLRCHLWAGLVIQLRILRTRGRRHLRPTRARRPSSSEASICFQLDVSSCCSTCARGDVASDGRGLGAWATADSASKSTSCRALRRSCRIILQAAAGSYDLSPISASSSAAPLLLRPAGGWRVFWLKPAVEFYFIAPRVPGYSTGTRGGSLTRITAAHDTPSPKVRIVRACPVRIRSMGNAPWALTTRGSFESF